MKGLRVVLAAAAAALVGCTPLPRPRVMSQADAAARSPAAVDSKARAPQAFQHAEELRREAEKAYDNGDQTAAQLLSEQALAGYNRAVVLARVVRAQARERAAAKRLKDAQAKLAELDAEQKRLAAQADDFELQAKVARDAIPPSPASPPSAERDIARREAAHSLATQARLLCLSARLLTPDATDVADDLKTLESFDDKVAHSSLAPIDEARKLHTRCLEHLTQARKPVMLRKPAAGTTDALLSELSTEGLLPFRDDRGVVVTLRDVFKTDTTLSADATKTLQSLGRAAKAHPSFPLLVVLHSARGKPAARDEQRGKALVAVLTKNGAERIETRAVGGAAPIVDPKTPGAAERNQRVEIVFVSPGP